MAWGGGDKVGAVMQEVIAATAAMAGKRTPAFWTGLGARIYSVYDKQLIPQRDADMRISIMVRSIFDVFRALAAALFASAAMSICISLLPAFANSALGIAGIFLMAITYMPLAFIGVAPIAICFVVVGLWLRNSTMRFPALLLAGVGSGAASAAVLSTKLLPAGQPGSGLLWLIALGSIGGFIGACVFAYLTPKQNRRLQSA